MPNGLVGGIAGGAGVYIIIRAIDKATGVFKKINKNMLAIGAGITGIGVAGAVALNNMVGVAADSEGAWNKFNTVFGEHKDDMTAFVKDIRTRMPTAEKDIVRMSADLQDLLIPMGISREEGAGMTKEFLELTNQIAAFNDEDPSRVLEAVRSGLVGEAEPLKRFGVDARIATLEMTAMNHGLLEAGQSLKDLDPEMQAQVRAQALLIQVTEDSADAIEGFEDNNDSLVRKQQNLSATIIDVKDQLGKALIPAFQIIVAVIQKVVNWFSNLTDGQKRFIAIAALVVTALFLIVGPLLMLLAILPMAKAGFILLSSGTLSAVKASLAFVAANIWWIVVIGLVIAAIVLLVKYWDYIKAALFALGKWFMKIFSWIWDIIKNWWKTLKGTFMMVGGLLKWLGAKWEQGWTGMILTFAKIWNKLIDFAETLVKNFVDVIISPINWIREKLGKEKWELPIDFSKAKVETAELQKQFEALKDVKLSEELAPGMKEMTEGAEGLAKAFSKETMKSLSIMPEIEEQANKIIQERAKTQEKITDEVEKTAGAQEDMNKQMEAISGTQEGRLVRVRQMAGMFKGGMGGVPEEVLQEKLGDTGLLGQPAVTNNYNFNAPMYGDPEEVSKAMSDELGTKMSL